MTDLTFNVKNAIILAIHASILSPVMNAIRPIISEYLTPLVLIVNVLTAIMMMD